MLFELIVKNNYLIIKRYYAFVRFKIGNMIYSVPKTLGTNEVKRQLALRVKKKARW